MKNILIFILFVSAVSTNVIAQYTPPSPTLSKEKMVSLLSWAGRWKGEGSMTMPNGEIHKSSVDEKVEAKLDNTLLMMEGVGSYTDPATKKEVIAHHALGVISYDPYTNQYKLKTYLKDGKSADAWFKVLSENNYQWGLETPMGKNRYTIQIDPVKKTWIEYGESSKDGTTWKKFFEMTLAKVE
jgi:hypothetical protein